MYSCQLLQCLIVSIKEVFYIELSRQCVTKEETVDETYTRLSFLAVLITSFQISTNYLHLKYQMVKKCYLNKVIYIQDEDTSKQFSSRRDSYIFL